MFFWGRIAGVILENRRGYFRESQDYFRESQKNSENRKDYLENRRETRRIAVFLDKADEADEADVSLM